LTGGLGVVVNTRLPEIGPAPALGSFALLVDPQWKLADALFDMRPSVAHLDFFLEAQNFLFRASFMLALLFAKASGEGCLPLLAALIIAFVSAEWCLPVQFKYGLGSRLALATILAITLGLPAVLIR
jgi:hypothetical protein